MDVPPNAEFESITANRQIKDGVFRLVFDDPEKAAELYNALADDKCTPDEIQIITLTTTISGELKNDLAFIARGKIMVIGEHMSTPYYNMPVRLLIYAGLLYEKWIKMRGEEKFMYGSKLYKIPTPEFVVFYNGTANMPEKETLRLSSAFENSNDNNLGFLELEVPVYNINKGMNEELFKKSPSLKQYSEFIAKLREFQSQYEDYSQAVKETVNHCIANDVLADFLRKEGGKIVSLLSTYDPEIAKRVYGDERADERAENIAIEMLRDGDSIEKIARNTQLSVDTVKNLKESLFVAG